MNLSYSLFKGASIQLDAIDLDPNHASTKIASLTSVKNVWPVRYFQNLASGKRTSGNNHIGNFDNSSKHFARTTADNGTDGYAPHVLTQVDKLHEEGFTGKGIRIGIVDSGVDYNHPALGGCFGEGCIVSYGTDLIGDNFNGTNTPVPDPDPQDCLGHGTHVSGIIAAQQNPLGFIGAAYGANLGMYRALNCEGISSNDVLIAAFNEAYEDGSDIISLSIGTISGWKEDPLSVAVSRIIDAGVPCVIANGNNGPFVFTSASPADGRGVMSVASIENTMTPLLGTEAFTSLDGSSDNLTSFVWVPGTPAFPNITLPLWVVTPNTTVDGSWNACSPLNENAPADLSDRIVLVELSGCSDPVIANSLLQNNGKYIMFYSPYDDFSNLYSVTTTPDTLGAGMVPLQQGQEWRDLLGNGTEVYATMVEPQSAGTTAAFFPNDSDGGYIDDFSSWGPTWEADLNPRIATPGGSILSTYPLSMGGYYVDSGTSMATPLMASIYALIMEARSIKDPKTLMSLVSSTAKQTKYHDYYTGIFYDGLAPVAQQGAGLAQAYDAVHATTSLSVSSISLNDTDHFVNSTAFTISNGAEQAVTYSIGHVPSLSRETYKTGQPTVARSTNPSNATATLTFSETNLTVPAGESVKIIVEVTPPQGLNASNLPVYGGYITLSGSNGESLVVPYLGVAASLKDSRSIDPGYSFIYHTTGRFPQEAPNNDTWTIPYPTVGSQPSTSSSIDYPALGIEADAGIPLLRADIIPLGTTPAKTTNVLGVDIAGSIYGYPVRWLNTQINQVAFNGVTQEGTILPEGNYAVLLRALKIFGDEENPDDYFTKQTGSFNIKYTST
ncbi:subtilisin-like protein [Trichoderma citrinoviride]|uniref:Subtilisin-like protein n=1 Tax=Trichoderma citrinoviride TaxID=58853 RepID=A0A2T4B8D1_9HYPO|nr:subtilisin-like protein [Trichoderma citrinoviride]PTB65481.1 subtilisin-like protein [Trichoderma citrinoviride]